MTGHDENVHELEAAYDELAWRERLPEGAQFSATMSDGTRVLVVALERELTARVPQPDRFLDTMVRAASVRHDALASPMSWGRTSSGLLHYARAALAHGEMKPGSFSATGVALLGARLARGLAAAHGNGLIHGAIATPRIAMNGDGDVVLDSFGLHAALTAAGLPARDAAEALSESPYISPEVQAGGDADERSDIYSLGATLYELLTGKPPFGGRTTAFVMATVLSDESLEQAKSSETADGVVVDALLRAIEREPDDRWQSAQAFANALAPDPAAAPASRAARAPGCLRFAAALGVLAVALGAVFVV
jgi:hypothetical protein